MASFERDDDVFDVFVVVVVWSLVVVLVLVVVVVVGTELNGIADDGNDAATDTMASSESDTTGDCDCLESASWDVIVFYI